jgi:hypothetical protein
MCYHVQALGRLTNHGRSCWSADPDRGKGLSLGIIAWTEGVDAIGLSLWCLCTPGWGDGASARFR